MSEELQKIPGWQRTALEITIYLSLFIITYHYFYRPVMGQPLLPVQDGLFYLVIGALGIQKWAAYKGV